MGNKRISSLICMSALVGWGTLSFGMEGKKVDPEESVWKDYLKNQQEHNENCLNNIKEYNVGKYLTDTRRDQIRVKLLRERNESLEQENLRLRKENYLLLWKENGVYQEFQNKWEWWQECEAAKERKRTTVASIVTFIGVAIGYQQKVVPSLRTRARSIKKPGWKKKILHFLAGDWSIRFLKNKSRKKILHSHSVSK